MKWIVAGSLAGLAASGFSFAQDEPAAVLTAPGIESLTLGGHLRLRVESRDPAAPLRNASSMNLQLLRARVRAEARIAAGAGALVELQESWMSAGAASVSSLHQAYGSLRELFGGAFDLHAGRFELKYGNQRMISPLDWHNVGRAWDGVKLVRRGAGYQLDLFATQPVAAPHATSSSGEDDFHGAYFQWLAGADWSWDFYLFRRRLAGPDFADWTFGTLAKGQAEAWSWDAELALQRGEHGPGRGGSTLDAAGFAGAVHAAYQWAGGASLGATYELASGRDGADDRFVPLFDFSHAYHGHADIVTWSNLQDLVLHGAVPVGGAWRLHGDLHWLRKHESGDAVYFGPGAAGTASTGASDIGNEIDLYLKGKLAGTADAWLGVSRFFAGDALRNGGDQSWIYLMTGFGF